MDLFKSLSQNGYHTIEFLQKSAYEFNYIKDQLEATHGEVEQYVARYLGAALEEINIARYLQEQLVEQSLSPHVSDHGVFSPESDPIAHIDHTQVAYHANNYYWAY